MIARRPVLAGLAALGCRGPALVLPDRLIAFPRDHGAHPDLRTEWWYVTGEVASGERRFGFQATFFRSRVDRTQAMVSRLAAKQLVFAHAALTDVGGRRLWHDQRIARQGFGIAEAATQDASLRIRDWTLVRTGDAWHIRLPCADFTLDLQCTPTQPVLLQGRQGLSRKGPDEAQASYYYSLPQMAVQGRVLLQGRPATVTGRAWLDHEWSEALLHPEAVGWDWIGMNLADGSALTAFRLRRQDATTLWDGGSFRTASGSLYVGSRGENEFRPQRSWTSPASGTTYPVEWLVRTPADIYTVRAVVDNQELDSRASTGAIYWEGLSDLFDSNGRKVGSGYLEMTGYGQRLRI